MTYFETKDAMANVYVQHKHFNMKIKKDQIYYYKTLCGIGKGMYKE